jgi:hypothetical protein
MECSLIRGKNFRLEIRTAEFDKEFVSTKCSVSFDLFRHHNDKQLENVKCFRYLGSLLTDDGRCT